MVENLEDKISFLEKQLEDLKQQLENSINSEFNEKDLSAKIANIELQIRVLIGFLRLENIKTKGIHTHF